MFTLFCFIKVCFLKILWLVPNAVRSSNTSSERVTMIPLRRWVSVRKSLTGVRKLGTVARPLRLLEVGPRDGLQNIKSSIPTATKIELINRLADAGVRDIEATSFVSPKWVPQLSDGAAVMDAIKLLLSGHRLPVLTPNIKGLENAIKAGAKEAVVFASATEAFSKKNQNCTVDEALNHSESVAKAAKEQGLAVRGVISCIFSDPYSGPTDAEAVLKVAQRFLAMGCHEVGLGDTLGVGTPKDTQTLLELLLAHIQPELLAGHFHDTYGQAVANVVRAYEMGIRSFDSSIAGLGGCPYAPGAKGNVATEDIVYTFEKSGVSTGIDLDKLAAVGGWISQQLGLANNSRAGAALYAKQTQVAQSPTSESADAIKMVPSKQRSWKEIEKTEGYSVARSGSAVKITLTRPNNGNAMTTEMLEGLTHILRSLATDATVFHVVIAADGKYFCTGMDLTGDSRDNTESYYGKIVDLFRAIDESPQTTVALIQGPCFGGGVGLGFACDIRLAAPNAKWTLSEIKLGLAPAIISKYMAREWGIPFLREAMLTGREVSPDELVKLGAVHDVAKSSEDLDDLLEVYLERLNKAAPRAATTCKELMRLAWLDPDGKQQNQVIEQTFNRMLVPGSEGEHGIRQFQKKIKSVDWQSFWNEKAKL